MKEDQTLTLLRTEKLGECTRCKLHTTRTKIVFGEGPVDPEILFVGEAPGATEDRSGRPFVGDSGLLLTRTLDRFKMSRDKVYIANVLKCRPPENRNPEEDEIAACSPFLHAQIYLIRPKLIVALGKFAAVLLSQQNMPMSALRKISLSYTYQRKEIPLRAIYHPSYVIRCSREGEMGALKAFVDDMERAVREARKGRWNGG